MPPSFFAPKKDFSDEEIGCLKRVRHHYEEYLANSQQGEVLRKAHGPLRIAAFCRLWPPPIHGTGGLQYHALHLYSQLANLGHVVHVFVTGESHLLGTRDFYFEVNPATHKLSVINDPAEKKTSRLIVHQVASAHNAEYSEEWFSNVLTEFKRINETVKFQVAHSESWAGVPNTFQIGLQMIVTWHGSMLDWFRNEVNLIVHNFRMKGKMTGSHNSKRMAALGGSVAFEAYMLLTVPHHVAISDSAANDLKQINLIEPNRVHLIYNGVNAKNFKPDRSARGSFLSRHNIDPNKFVVGCGGRLEGIKGHHQLSSAMAIILQKHADVTLLVAGTGGESTRYEKLKMQGLSVVLLGMLTQDELAHFYQSLDIFVDPYYQHHGLNTVMIEAALSGVPIIATGLASSQTTAPCEDYGRTFALGNIPDLVSQIEYFKSHPEVRAEVSRNVRERALSLFTSSVMAGSYEALLYSTLQNPTPLHPIDGKVVCRNAYPAMCYREPDVSDRKPEK